MENNTVEAKSRGFMVGMGPQSVPAITILISFEENDSENPSLCYEIHLPHSLAQLLIGLAQSTTLS